MNRIAFLVDNLGPSQSSYFLIDACNRWLAESPHNDAVVFVNSMTRPVIAPKFGVMQLAEVAGYTGIAVATSFPLAATLLQSHGPRQRYFYCQDLDWARQVAPASYWSDVYEHSLLRLLARSASHAKLLAKTWGQSQVPVIDDFSVSEILKATQTW
jgi:hypothetical protein